MRVIHILNHSMRLNGNVHAAIDLACAQKNLGHDVAFVSGGGDFDALIAANGLERFVIEQRRQPVALLKAVAAIHALVRDWKPDIVHAHMMTSAGLCWPICRLAGVPLITTVHNEFQRSSVLMGLGTRVIAVSHAVGRSMHKRGVPGSRLKVVLNGTVGSARLAGRSREPLALSSPSVLFVGGQHPRKGVPDLIEAFRLAQGEVPAARLHIVGGGPFLEAYRNEAAAVCLPGTVTFHGPQDNPLPWMTGADIFVLPSHADPAPLVLPEAREAGCAVVATDVDGARELLDGGQAGILVPPRDPRRLADALLRLMKDPAELALWKANALSNLESLTIERVARQTFDVYEEALASRSLRKTAPERA